MQDTYVRRHPDNSIDYGFYRRQAARIRARAMRDFVRRFRIGLLAAGTVAAFAIAASGPAHRVYCPDCTGTSSSAIPTSAAISMVAAPTRAE